MSSLMPPPINVSTYKDYSFLERIRNGTLNRFPHVAPFGGYDDKLRLPTMESRYHTDGLGVDPPNQSSNITLHSPGLYEYDYLEPCRYVPGVPLFVCKEHSDELGPEDMRVDIPHLNYRMEQTATQQYKAFGLNDLKRKNYPVGEDYMWKARGGMYDPMWPKAPGHRDRARTFLKGLPAYAEYGSSIGDGYTNSWTRNYGDIATDFMRKWTLSGFTVTMTDDQTVSERESDDVRTASEHSRAIVMSVAGDCEVKNMFSPAVGKGDRVYFVVAPTQVSQLGSRMVTPDGSTSPYGSIPTGECVQIRGVSTADDFNEFVSMTSRMTLGPDGLQRNNGFIKHSASEPFATERTLDHDYELRDQVLQAEGFIFEEDGMGGVKTRLTDDIDDLPPTVTDIYSLGHVIRVGIVTYVETGPTTSEAIAEAHRVLDTLKMLPLLRVIHTL